MYYFWLDTGFTILRNVHVLWVRAPLQANSTSTFLSIPEYYRETDTSQCPVHTECFFSFSFFFCFCSHEPGPLHHAPPSRCAFNAYIHRPAFSHVGEDGDFCFPLAGLFGSLHAWIGNVFFFFFFPIWEVQREIETRVRTKRKIHPPVAVSRWLPHSRALSKFRRAFNQESPASPRRWKTLRGTLGKVGGLAWSFTCNRPGVGWFAGSDRVGGHPEDQGKHAGGGEEVWEGLRPTRLFHTITLHESLDPETKLTILRDKTQSRFPFFL